jgi:hypothetical protein
MARLIVKDHETNSTIAVTAVDFDTLPDRLSVRDWMLKLRARQLHARCHTTLANADLWYVVVDDNNVALAKGQL